MEISAYYPLRIGKYSSCIVSDMPVTHRNKKEMDSECEHYGGFVIAESIPAEIAKEFVDLFNKKYSCPASLDGGKCMGGRMCCQSKISHHEWVEQQNQLDKENSAHSFNEGSEHSTIGRKTICTQPECDCLEQAEKKAGGPVKKYECLARDPADEMKAKSSGLPTLDEQIAFIKQQKATAMFIAINENLKAIKRWNETPVYHGKIDVVNVIADFIILIKKNWVKIHQTGSTLPAENAIRQGEEVVDMINRFKEEREVGMAPRDIDVLKDFNRKPMHEITAKDVAKAHHAGKNILDRKSWETYPFIPQTERDAIVDDISKMLPNIHDETPMSSVMDDNKRMANAIIFAIERMDDLKRKHGK